MSDNFVVDINVSTSSASVSTANFSRTVLFTNDAPVSGVTFAKGSSELFTSATTVGTKFGTSSNTYKAAAALMASDLTPNKFRVYRRNDEVAIVKSSLFSADFITGNSVVAIVNGITLDAVPYVTSHATTIGNLATAIADNEFIDTCTSSVRTLTITANSGAPLDISFTITGGATQPTVTTTVTTAGFSIADDILALNASVDNDCYWISEVTHDKDVQLMAAQTVQALKKQFIFSTNEADCLDSTATDIIALVNNGAYTRTTGLYSANDNLYPEMAWLGRVTPFANGSITFAGKTLNGQTATALTESQMTNLKNKKGNYYVENGGVNITYPGTAAGGNSIEFLWDIDYFQAKTTENVYRVFVNNNKIPFNQAGINQMASPMVQTVNQMISQGVLDAFNEDGSQPIIVIPNISDISAEDRAARLMSGYTLKARHLEAGISFTANFNVTL
jgi:hypothetical protein